MVINRIEVLPAASLFETNKMIAIEGVRFNCRDLYVKVIRYSLIDMRRVFVPIFRETHHKLIVDSLCLFIHELSKEEVRGLRDRHRGRKRQDAEAISIEFGPCSVSGESRLLWVQ